MMSATQTDSHRIQPNQHCQGGMPSHQRRDDTTDAQLVASAMEGDGGAFECLARKYELRITKLASKLVGEADAPDVTQETLLKAYRGLSGFRGQSAFYTWLYRIAVNTAKNLLVDRQRKPAAQDIDATHAEEFGHTQHMSDIDTPESIAMSEEINNKLAETIARLPNELRKAITLREIHGLAYDEIANVLRCPVGTVRSRIFRAREAIDGVLTPLLAA